MWEQKLITEAEDTITPEHYLWTSVLSKAAHDAIYGSDWREAKLAIEWFKSNSVGFREVCSYAGKNPQYVYRKMKKPIATREADMKMVQTGGRYYVKESKKLATQYYSHYRSHNQERPPHKWRCGVQRKSEQI
jgi:hypothetical protein